MILYMLTGNQTMASKPSIHRMSHMWCKSWVGGGFGGRGVNLGVLGVTPLMF